MTIFDTLCQTMNHIGLWVVSLDGQPRSLDGQTYTETHSRTLVSEDKLRA